MPPHRAKLGVDVDGEEIDNSYLPLSRNRLCDREPISEQDLACTRQGELPSAPRASGRHFLSSALRVASGHAPSVRWTESPSAYLHARGVRVLGLTEVEEATERCELPLQWFRAMEVHFPEIGDCESPVFPLPSVSQAFTGGANVVVVDEDEDEGFEEMEVIDEHLVNVLGPMQDAHLPPWRLATRFPYGPNLFLPPDHPRVSDLMRVARGYSPLTLRISIVMVSRSEPVFSRN